MQNVKKIRKIVLSSLITSLIMLVCLPFFSYAQTQTGTLDLGPGIIQLQIPNDFNFDPVFIPENTDPTFDVYKTLLPQTDGEIIKVLDADETGLNYKVTMAMSNFESSTSSIAYTNFSMATLANDTALNVDADPGSLPADQVNVTAPAACSWNGQGQTNLGDNCSTELDGNGFPANGTTISSDPTLTLTATDTLVPVADSSLYQVDDIISFSTGENALVTEISSPTLIRVQRNYGGIAANTTPAAGGGITIFTGNTSEQIDVLVGIEPPGGRIAAHSVGLGIRGRIPKATVEPGTYTGTITFTLYTCSDLSCI